MRTLAIALTCVFVTLKLTDNVTWPWFWVVSPFVFWCILALVFMFLGLWVKAAKRIEEEEREESRSKWQKRLDEMRAVREHNKMLILVLVLCVAMYSCRPAQNVTACPKPFSGKFNK